MRKYTRCLSSEALFAVLLLALVFVVRLPSIQQPLDNDSGAIAYHARLINQGEPLYGTHHPAHHLPGAYYTYALIFRLLGDNPISLKIVLIPWVWLTAWLLFRIGKQLGQDWVGKVAAVLFALTASITNLHGDTAKIELFGNLPLTLGMSLAVGLLTKRSRPLMYLLPGMVGALAFLFKANYLAALAGLGFVIFLDAVLERSRIGWITFFKRSLALIAGTGIVLGMVAGYFISQGLWQRFLLIFKLGNSYMAINQDEPAILLLLIPFIILTLANASLCILGLVGTIRILRRIPGNFKKDRMTGLIHTLLITWVVISLVETGFSRMAFVHYGLLLIPPFSFLGAMEAASIRKQLMNKNSRLAWVAPLLVAAIITNAILGSSDYFGGYVQYVFGQKTYNAFVRQNIASGPARIAAISTASYITANTLPQETIFLWSDQAQIYYYANRRASVDVIWPVYVAALGPTERVFALPPRYIVIGPIQIGDAIVPGWLAKELKNNYTYEKTIGTHDLYRRTSP